ncbi:MAG: hypothetical protein ACM3ZE_30905, partial [Myxococcales bacterium]
TTLGRLLFKPGGSGCPGGNGRIAAFRFAETRSNHVACPPRRVQEIRQLSRQQRFTNGACTIRRDGATAAVHGYVNSS